MRLGVLPLKEPLDGIDVDIRIAKALNSCLKKSSEVVRDSPVISGE